MSRILDLLKLLRKVHNFAKITFLIKKFKLSWKIFSKILVKHSKQFSIRSSPCLAKCHEDTVHDIFRETQIKISRKYGGRPPYLRFDIQNGHPTLGVDIPDGLQLCPVHRVLVGPCARMSV
jgi:hypothetical protein